MLIATLAEGLPQITIFLESLLPNMPLSKHIQFAIQKGISGIAGTVKDVKKLRSGQILIECQKNPIWKTSCTVTCWQTS